MPTYTDYEWSIETTDDDGDVIDHNFTDSLLDWPSTYVRTITDPVERLVLVRTTYGSRGTRTWAYAKRNAADGKFYLPAVFDDCETRVPARFHDELKKSQRGRTKK